MTDSKIHPFGRSSHLPTLSPPDPAIYTPPVLFRIAQRVGTNDTTYSPPLPLVEAFCKLIELRENYARSCEIRALGNAFVAERRVTGCFVASVALVNADEVEVST